MKSWDTIKKTAADTIKAGVLATGIAAAGVPAAEAQTMTGTATERIDAWRFGNFVDLTPTKKDEYKKLYPGRNLTDRVRADDFAYFQKMLQERVAKFRNAETDFKSQVDAVGARGGTFRLNMSAILYPNLFQPFGGATHGGYTVVDIIIRKDEKGKVVGTASLQDPKYPSIDYFIGFELN